MYSTPLCLQAAISDDEIGREASLMSVSPLQNFWKPPPVPDTPTVTRTSWLARWNSSATASLMGKTVLDPSTRTTAPPLPSDPGVELPPPQAVVRAAATAAHTKT